MEIDAKGHTLAGHAGPGWWVDGQQILPPSAGNDPVFWQGRCLGNDEHSRLTSTNLAGQDRLVHDSRGCSAIFSDGAEWAAFVQDGRTGVYTSWGLDLPAGQAYGMTPGTLFGRPVFQSAGGLAAWPVGTRDPNAMLWQEPGAVVLDFAPLDTDRVAWTDNARRLVTRGLPPLPPQTGPISAPVLLEIGGQLWVLGYLDYTGLVLRPWDDALHGYLLVGAPGTAWGPCARVLDDASVEIAWGTNPSELGAPGRVTVNVAVTPLRDLFVPTPIPAFPQAVCVVPFFPTPDMPGQAAIVANGQDFAQVAPPSVPIIASLDALDCATPEASRLLGVLATQHDVAAAVTRAQTLNTRVFCYYDGPEPFPINTLQQLRAYDLPLLLLYWDRSDPDLARVTMRWDANLSHLLQHWPGPIGVIPQCYTGGTLLSLQQVLDLQPLTAERIAREPRVQVCAPFAWSRQDGATGWPPIADAMRLWAQASTHGMPTWPPLDGVVEPPEPEQPPEPEPIPPQPEPEPPQPPKERVMQISLDSLQKFDSPQTITEVDHPDGQGLKALKTDKGKFKSITPDGKWDEDKDSAGAWESFLPQGGVYLHYVGETQTYYSVSCVTAAWPGAQAQSTGVDSPQPMAATVAEPREMPKGARHHHGQSPIMGGEHGPHEPQMPDEPAHAPASEAISPEPDSDDAAPPPAPPAPATPPKKGGRK